ncbi:PP2C family protein-serine/threonine phosphatase [Streptantibioticus ferralitis]
MVAFPLALIAVICVVDILSPPHIHLGPLLVAAPAVTVAFAGVRLTALIGVLAVGAQVLIGVMRGVLATANLEAQIAALIVVSGLLVALCLVRDRHERQLRQVRSVAEAAQHVLLRPLPRRSGPLRIGCLYLPAEEEAEMGGDLYAAARTPTSTRLLIGDVRGKGLAAISHAALLLGAFRAAAHRQATLPRLAVHLDGATRWDTSQWQGDADQDTDESFATATFLDLPDHEAVVHLIACGHPPPLLFHDDSVTTLPAKTSHLPIGLGGLIGSNTYDVETFPFEDGDLLLFYTDGVSEARDADGRFYPLRERAAAWTRCEPEELIRHLCADLLAHVDGHLGDDAAVVAIRRGAV